jgi:hypothetical protein
MGLVPRFSLRGAGLYSYSLVDMAREKRQPPRQSISSIPTLERRRFIRHPLCFPLVYSVISGNKVLPGAGGKSTTIDISMGGLLFAAKRPVGKGATILIKMPFKDKLFNVKGKVMHCEKSPETRLHNIGVCFYRLKDAFKVKLIEQFYLISEFRDLMCIQRGKEVSLEDASREWVKRYSVRFRKLYG